jgi:hypothetical protein
MRHGGFINQLYWSTERWSFGLVARRMTTPPNKVITGLETAVVNAPEPSQERKKSILELFA